MKRGECGFAYPPEDGTHDREVMDRFADFLREMGRPPYTKDELDAGVTKDGKPIVLASPATRYRCRFLAWRVGQVGAVQGS